MQEETRRPDPGVSRPGRMTAVMRAVAAPCGPRALRVGVVSQGRVVRELRLEPRATFSVGTEEHNTLVLPAPAPRSARVLEWRDGAYQLYFNELTAGRVVLAHGSVELAELSRRQPDGARRVTLAEDGRGKLRIGETTLLFQLVVVPPRLPRPQLPASVTRGQNNVDWPTTMVAAGCLLLHFAAVGLLYSDWMDPAISDPGVAVRGSVRTVRSFPDAPSPTDPESKQSAEPAASRDAPPRQASSSAGRAASPGRGAAQASDNAALVGELEAVQLKLLAALGGAGPATDEVLAAGDLPTDSLDRAAARDSRVSRWLDGLAVPGAPSMRPGQTAPGLDISTRKVASEDTGKARQTRGPDAGQAGVGQPAIGGTLPGAEGVVAGMRPSWRRCYNRGLQTHPDAQGSIQLSITVGPGGEVQAVGAAPSGSLPASVVSCVQSRAYAAQFSPPEGGTALVRVPVSFWQQR